ncbi:MAG: four helix bundle protein [Candidatus Omnitrophica bacterium]|nr:four helix bundle protein [Candidatus Omnitrophota bacterium]
MNSVQFTGIEEPSFDFERLKVYQASLEFLDQIFDVSLALPRETQSSLGDQLRRAGLSISNNIAEGSGKRFKREKTRYYCTASDSTRECLSMLNILQRRKLLGDGQFAIMRRAGREITSMIHGLINAL